MNTKSIFINNKKPKQNLYKQMIILYKIPYINDKGEINFFAHFSCFQKSSSFWTLQKVYLYPIAV